MGQHAPNIDPALAEEAASAGADELIEGIVRLARPGELPPGFTPVTRLNRICTGRFRAGDLMKIRRHPSVRSLKAARPLAADREPEEDTEGHARPQLKGPDVPLGYDATGVLVAALDFGVDVACPEFVNEDGSTRFDGFWDQGAQYDAAHPNRFGYGRIFARAEIDAALRSGDPYAALKYHPARSGGARGSHGTHTLSIAAGNGRASKSRASAASGADLAFVHLSTPKVGFVGDLGDSVRLLEALDFVDALAGRKSWVANLSVGRTAGSHCGTSLLEQGMLELLTMHKPRSCAICQSAGNYHWARLSAEGRLHQGEVRDLPWIMEPADVTTNELDCWYPASDELTIAIRMPGARDFQAVPLGAMATLTHEGEPVARLYHRRHDPNAHAHHAEFLVYPRAPRGVWTIRLIGEFIVNGRYNAWIERDMARPGQQSRFDPGVATGRFTLGTIATAPLPITVGALNEDLTRPAPFSSSGPCRDLRADKPELLAPGTSILAARSAPPGATSSPGDLVARSGTSMAAPAVAGVVAAMMQAASKPVSIQVIRDCLRRSARPIDGDYDQRRCAWGALDPALAIEEILRFSREPSEGGAQMNAFAVEDFLSRAAEAYRSAQGDRLRTEMGYLASLLRECGVADPLPYSPCALIQALRRQRPEVDRLLQSVEVIGLPGQRPRAALRAGDIMLRGVPGTGDVGHVSVLASDGLSESADGYYGDAIESYGLRHGPGRFLRRFLSGAGYALPFALLMRPRVHRETVMVVAPEREMDDLIRAVDVEDPEWDIEQTAAAKVGDYFKVVDPDARIRGGPPDFGVTRPLRTIPRNTGVRIIELQGAYARIKGPEGNVLGWTALTNLGTFFKDDPTLVSAPLAAVASIAVDRTWTAKKRAIANTYNRVGGLMSAVARATGAPLAGCLAVWYVESGGIALTPEKMIIRFENHRLHKYWGRHHPEVYARHFQHGGPNGGHENHRFRERAEDEWTAMHVGKAEVSQPIEYRVLRFATQLAGEEIALQCISMGGPQIMGDNHALIGYPSAKDMYDHFQRDERWHVLGFFDFCQFARQPRGQLIDYLRKGNFGDFASAYNGGGQKETYAKWISEAAAAASELGAA